MDLPTWTYNDLALKLGLDPKTVSRWVLRLERKGKLKPFRPTKGTVRLRDRDVETLLSLHHGRVRLAA